MVRIVVLDHHGDVTRRVGDGVQFDDRGGGVEAGDDAEPADCADAHGLFTHRSDR